MKRYETQIFIKTSWYPALKNLKVKAIKLPPPVTKDLTKTITKNFTKNLELINETFKKDKQIPLLTNCQNCPNSLIANRGEVCISIHAKTKLRPKILFVGDRPRTARTSENSHLCYTEEVKNLLAKMISAMKLTEDEVEHTLAVKCFSNSEEIGHEEIMAKHCKEHLYSEINQLQPQLVVSLGALATNILLESPERLSKVHGQIIQRKVTTDSNKTISFNLVPLFHPDFLLINPNMKRTTWIDMQKIMDYLKTNPQS